MSVVIWVHADCLHRAGPAFQKYPDAPAVFVWDEEFLAAEGWGLKRIGFIYECLLELPVTILRGDPSIEVTRFAREHSASLVVAVDSPDPRFRVLASKVNDSMPLETLPPEPFVMLRANADLRRFSRYWKEAEPQLMR